MTAKYIPTFGYSDTPTRLPPVPRQVRASGSWIWGLWFTRLFMMPHTLIGVGAALFWLFMLLAACFGQRVPAQVEMATISHSTKHGDSYTVRYHYQVGDRSYPDESGSVSKTVYDQLTLGTGAEAQRRGKTITVQHFNIGPFHKSETHSFWPTVGFFTLFAGFWNTVMGIAAYGIWVVPLRRRWLCGHGQATTGAVVSTRERTGKSRSYYVTYRFSDPATGATIEREVQVADKETWRATNPGDAATILYSPRNPKHFTAYESCGYRVIGAGGLG